MKKQLTNKERIKRLTESIKDFEVMNFNIEVINTYKNQLEVLQNGNRKNWG